MMFIKYGLTDTKRLNVLFHYFGSYQQAICWDNLRDPKANILALRYFFGQMSTEIMRTSPTAIKHFFERKRFFHFFICGILFFTFLFFLSEHIYVTLSFYNLTLFTMIHISCSEDLAYSTLKEIFETPHI